MDEKLKLVNDATFIEAEPPEGRSRPFEWRKSFNTINLNSDVVTVEQVYSINEVDDWPELHLPPESAESNSATGVVTGTGRRYFRVIFLVDQDALYDTILCTRQVEKDSKFYSLHRTKGDIKVTLRDANPTNQRGPFAKGAYAGLAFTGLESEDDDRLNIEVGIPAHLMEEIADAFLAGTASSLQASVSLQSFSYEVDDALRDSHHPRDLFIHGGATPAALLSLRILRRETKPAISEESENRHLDAIQARDPPSPDFAPILKSIKTALWVVAGILMLQLFLRIAIAA